MTRPVATARRDVYMHLQGRSRSGGTPRPVVTLLGVLSLGGSLAACATSPVASLADSPLASASGSAPAASTASTPPACPDQLRQDLQMQFGEPAVAITGAELGARLGVSVPEGFACIYTGSSGYVGSTAYLVFYHNANQSTADAIDSALADAGFTQDETGRWDKDGQWGLASAYPAGDQLHYGDYFNDAAMVIFEGSIADQ